MFRCIKAPFTRSEERAIEIVCLALFIRHDHMKSKRLTHAYLQGPPTNFRKEELPACFSDAESVISPNQNTTECPILTKDLQHVDVAGQPGSENGEDRDSDRDGGSAITRGQDSDSSAGHEHSNAKPRLLERLRLTRWFRSTQREEPEQDHEI